MSIFLSAPDLKGRALLKAMLFAIESWMQPPEADAIEVSPCQQDGDCVNNIAFEPRPEGDVFWSVYYHDGVNGGVQCVADFSTQEAAEFFGLQLAEEWGVDYGFYGFAEDTAHAK